MEQLLKEYADTNLETTAELKTYDFNGEKDFIGGKNQSTFSIGRGGSGNVAMARDNYTSNELHTHNEIFEILNG